jgi:excisionase family DNA binding protein
MLGTTETRQNDLMDIQQLADRLGVGVRYVRRLVAERRVPYIKLGHLLRFDPTDNKRVDRAGEGRRDSPPGTDGAKHPDARREQALTSPPAEDCSRPPLPPPPARVGTHCGRRPDHEAPPRTQAWSR